MTIMPSLKEMDKAILAQLRPSIFALVIELVYADGEPADAEWNELRVALSALFDMSDEHVMEVLSEAAAQPAKHDIAASCMELKARLSQQQKGELIILLWRVAFADSVIDSGELKVLRSVAIDIGLTNSQFSALRNTVREGV